jgi:hypothetical protein
MQDSVSRILIPTQQKFVELLEHLPNKYINVEILPLESQSMCETVLKTIQAKICQDIAIIMPDTFFSNTEVYKGIKHDKHDITVFCWQIQQNQKGKLGQVLIEGKLIKEVLDKDINCNFPNFWGAIKISNPYLKYISSSDAHFGVYMNRVIAENIDVHASISMGDYYDCGSPESYFDCIKYV